VVLGEHAPVEAGFLGQAGLVLYIRDDLAGREVEGVDAQ
jgi:hypothetical protein